MKKTLVLLIMFLLLIGEFGCSKKKKEEQIIDEEPTVEIDDFWIEEEEIEEIEESLECTTLEDYENGAINANDVVELGLSNTYDQESEDSGFDFDTLMSFADEHWDELELETQKEYYEKVFLGGINFADEEESTLLNDVTDTVFEPVSADDPISCTLTKVIVSSNQHFLIWYTTAGENAVSDDYAKQAGEMLEEIINKYDELYDVTYSFEYDRKITGSVLNKQRKMLENNGIDKKLIETCLSVYIVDTHQKDTKNALAYYSHNNFDVSALLDILASAYGVVNEGIAVVPYIVIKPDSIGNTVNCKQVLAHEMFHHYQQQILCGETKHLAIDDYIIETTADLSAALITENTTTTNATLNDWASLYGTYTHNWKSVYGRRMGHAYAGYISYPILYNYTTAITNGLENIIDCLYSDDFYGDLEDMTNIAQRNKMMRLLLLHTLNNDYTNKNLQNNYKYKIPYNQFYQNDEGGYDGTRLVSVDPMGFRYHRIIKPKGYNIDFEFSSLEEGMDAVLIAKVNGKYQIIQSYSKSAGKLSTVGFDDIYEFFVVPFNTSFTFSGYYDFTPVLTEATMTEIPLEDPVSGEEDLIIEEGEPSAPSEETNEPSSEIIIQDEENIIEANQTVLDDETLKVVAGKLEIKDGTPTLYATVTNKSGSPLNVGETYLQINGIRYGNSRCRMLDSNGKEIGSYSLTLKNGESIEIAFEMYTSIKVGEYQYEDCSIFKAFNISTLAKLEMVLNVRPENGDNLKKYFAVKTKYYDSYDFNQSILESWLNGTYNAKEMKYSVITLNNNVNRQLGSINVLADAVVMRENGSLTLLVEMNMPENQNQYSTVLLSCVNSVHYDDLYLNNNFYNTFYEQSGHHRIVVLDLDKVCDEKIRGCFGLVQIGDLTYKVTSSDDEISITETWDSEVLDLNGKLLYNHNNVTVFLLGMSQQYDDWIDKEFEDGMVYYFLAVSYADPQKRVSINGEDNNGNVLIPSIMINGGEMWVFTAETDCNLDDFEYANVTVHTEVPGDYDTYVYEEGIILTKE